MKGGSTRSPLLPGGDIVSALFNREVMGLADRGGASNLIGERWADIAATHAATWIGSERRLHADDQEPLRIMRVDRLDAMPAVAAAASRRGLQNPDLLLIGQRGDRQAIQAADAKFSVETARSKQVSPEVVLGSARVAKPRTRVAGRGKRPDPGRIGCVSLPGLPADAPHAAAPAGHRAHDGSSRRGGLRTGRGGPILGWRPGGRDHRPARRHR